MSSVTLALGSNPPGGNLYGTLTVQAISGIATFLDIYVDKAGTGYTLTASADGMAPVTSSSFSIVSGSPSQLAFAIQPSNTGAGISPIFQVAIKDAF